MQSLDKALLLDVRHITLRVTHQEFELLCQDNPDRSLDLSGEDVLPGLTIDLGSIFTCTLEFIGTNSDDRM